MLKNPIIHFSFRHDTDWDSPTGSMKAVIDSVTADLQLDKKELDKKLTKIMSMFDFGQKGVSDYVSQATDAAKALRGLLDLVEAVAESGWPEKFTKPVRTV
ncbi:hypothetical protein A5666_24420 [Mycolicibacterium fortuitum]|nr:hypothetical protein A5665_24540 [Mycolicibacterium fortuitum]OBI69907.1 hypothetical protein A5666_24420 [Mycolicibacterium fortuitum]